MKPLRLAAIVAAALLATLAIRWPLSWTVGWLPGSVQCADPAGSVWRGRCAALTVGQMGLGATSWQLQPLGLLRGVLAATVQSRQGPDRLDADIELRLGGRRTLRNVDAELRLGEGLLQQNAMGLRGQLQLQLSRLALDERIVREIEGTITVRKLAQGTNRAMPLGDYQLVFPPGSLHGNLRDLGGPLGVTGTLALTGEPGYLVEGLVTVRADTPPPLARSISLLGTPDAAGRRPFSFAGTY